MPMPSHAWRVAQLLIPLALVPACQQPLPSPDLGGLYDRAARSPDDERNPVIVIPGILGSKLVDRASGRLVWGAFAGDYADPTTPDGARLVALPMRVGAPLATLRDEVVPAGVLDRVKVSLLGLPIELKAYLNILATLGVGGYRDELLGKVGAVDYGDRHFTCFQFDYDWRRDCVENAARLHEFMLERREYIARELSRRSGGSTRPIKFDLVAHSMGGLIARYYLQYGAADLPDDDSLPKLTWTGRQLVARAIIIGTPNAGSVGAIQQLVEGAYIGPTLPSYPAAVVGTMPSVYELLPRSRHRPLVRADRPDEAAGDILDPSLWRRMRWGLADPRQDRVLARLLPEVSEPTLRREIALEHLEKCLRRARQFHAALDQPARPPAGLQLYLFAGDAVPTDAVLAADDATGRVRVAHQAPGDGTVPRTSALMDERLGSVWSRGLVSPIAWTHVTFLFADHLGLTKDPAFSDNVLYLLLESPR
jgi:pimeloyl-ACP methyl ester carboxylesterase